MSRFSVYLNSEGNGVVREFRDEPEGFDWRLRYDHDELTQRFYARHDVAVEPADIAAIIDTLAARDSDVHEAFATMYEKATNLRPHLPGGDEHRG